VRIDGGDVLGDDSVNVSGGAHENRLGCVLNAAGAAGL
jgi:hypothetical protein